MTVAFDVFGASASGSSDRTIEHNPTGTPRGVVMWLSSSPGVDRANAASYEGVALAEVTGSPNNLGTGETGTVSCFFLGASVPTNDPATALITLTGGGENILYVVTLTAAADTEVVDSDGSINSTSVENPAATLSLAGRDSWCGIGFWSGQDAATGITPFANWTSRSENDISTELQACYTYDTIGSTDVSAGWTQTAEDAVGISVAISEVAAPGGAIAGTAALSFSSTAGTMGGAGALAGPAAMTFGGSAVITGAAPIAGVATITFSNTGTILGAGALAAIGTITFTNTATLLGAGALVGASPLTFTLSGTMELPAGEMAGVVAFTFSNTGTLLGAGALAGSSDIILSGSGTLNDASEPAPAPAPETGFKMDWDVGARRKREEQRPAMDKDDEDAIAAILAAELATYDNSRNYRRRSP